VRLCERNNSADTKVSHEVGGGGAPDTAADSPVVCGENRGEAGCAPAAHGGLQWSRSPPAAHGPPHVTAGGYLKEAVTSWEAHAGAGSWQDLWTRERSPHQSRFADGAFDPVGDTR